MFVAAAAVMSGMGCQGNRPQWAFIAGRETPAAKDRPDHWGRRIHSDGMAYLFEVAPGLYRGSEPGREGLEQLQQLGIRTVVNMRSWQMHSTAGRMKGLPMTYRQIFMKAWEPTDQAVAEFLRIAADPANQPVFVHCYTGGDRAGLMVAAYRVAVQGWSKEDAIAEMRLGGYTYHEIFDRWYPQYIQQMDVPQMRRLAGIRPPEGNGRYAWDSGHIEKSGS
jgi:protein tyrosine phosphatase (PTP) superfamily phosphohydrolase (DUF442 family)